MLREYEIMLSCIRSQIMGIKVAATAYEGLDEDCARRLYTIAKEHDVAHIVAAELRERGACVPIAEIAAKLEKQQMIALIRSERMEYDLANIKEIFEQARIANIALKGSVLRKYYPSAWMRTSSDIDVLIHPEDVRAARAVLAENGYREQETTAHDVQFFSPSGMHIEIHFDTISDDCLPSAAPVLDGFWQASKIETGSEYSYKTDDAMFYFYHLAHMAKHIKASGCGVRFFVDTWILNERIEFDSDARRSLLERGGLYEFYVAVKELTDAWFSGAEHTDRSRRLENFVLRSGAYGSQETEYIADQKKKGSMAKYIIGRIFLPYYMMIHLYPSLLGRKYLLPIYWVRRWFGLLFGGKGRISSQYQKMKQANAKVEEFSAFLGEIGIE